MKIIKKIAGSVMPARPFNLIDAVNHHDEKNIIRHLATKSSSKNPVAIPYTPEAIRDDLKILYEFQNMYQPTQEEYAAAIVIKMLHLTLKSAIKWLAAHEYTAPDLAHMVYINTYLNTMQTLQQFSSSGIKKYKISSCNDERVCNICKKHNGQSYSLSEAVIGKTAPPLCKECRCLIRPVFK